MDSNLRSLEARHVSSVLVSTAHPYFQVSLFPFDIAKVDRRFAVFLRSGNYFLSLGKKTDLSRIIFLFPMYICVVLH